MKNRLVLSTALFGFALNMASPVNAAITTKNNATTQDLVCELKSRSPELSDMPVGSIRPGYLGIYSGTGASEGRGGRPTIYEINIADGVELVNAYDTNGGSWKDDGDVVTIKNNWQIAVFKRSTGWLQMHGSSSTNDYRMDSTWACTLM